MVEDLLCYPPTHVLFSLMVEDLTPNEPETSGRMDVSREPQRMDLAALLVGLLEIYPVHVFKGRENEMF